MIGNGDRYIPGNLGGGGGSGGTTPLIGSYTYAQLQTLVAANGLEVGYYLLNDFTTIYDRPDFVDNTGTIEPKSTITTVTAAAEPLILFAVDANSFAPEAFSPSNPSDIIQYQFAYTTPVNAAATKGRIIYRQDTVQQVECAFDFRAITFKFYNHADGRGNVWYFDSTGADTSALVAPFQTYASVRNFNSLPAVSLVVEICQGFDLPNFTIAGAASVVNVAILANTSIQSTEELTADAVAGNVIGTGFNYNDLGLLFDNVIGNSVRNNRIGMWNTCTIGNDMADCIFSFLNECILAANFQSVNGTGMSAQDLSAATIVYDANSSKDISRSPDNTTYVTYTSNLGVLTTVVVTT